MNSCKLELQHGRVSSHIGVLSLWRLWRSTEIVICFTFRDMKKRGGRQHCCQKGNISPRISETSVPEGLRENAAC